jgi:hypothetical protein
MSNFSELVGKTIIEISGLEKNSDYVRIKCADNSEYVMYHNQDCCESVSIEDVVGDPKDLIDSPILQAE